MPLLATVSPKTNAAKAVTSTATAAAKLLVVDDEALILSYLKDELEEAGYRVAVASSSDEALVALDDHATTLFALVTDVRLHGPVDGWQVARRARARRPDLPIVYMTGHAAGEWSAYGVSNSLVLQKPFLARDLLTALRRLSEGDCGPVNSDPSPSVTRPRLTR